jgi:hypothetical protein
MGKTKEAYKALYNLKKVKRRGIAHPFDHLKINIATNKKGKKFRELDYEKKEMMDSVNIGGKKKTSRKDYDIKKIKNYGKYAAGGTGAAYGLHKWNKYQDKKKEKKMNENFSEIISDKKLFENVANKFLKKEPLFEYIVDFYSGKRAGGAIKNAVNYVVDPSIPARRMKPLNIKKPSWRRIFGNKISRTKAAKIFRKLGGKAGKGYKKLGKYGILAGAGILAAEGLKKANKELAKNYGLEGKLNNNYYQKYYKDPRLLSKNDNYNLRSNNNNNIYNYNRPRNNNKNSMDYYGHF